MDNVQSSDKKVCKKLRKKKKGSPPGVGAISLQLGAMPSDEQPSNLEQATLEPRRNKRRRVPSKSVEVASKRMRLTGVSSSEDLARQTFKTLVPQLGAPLLKALQEQAYVIPTPVQAQSLPLTLEGLDVIAVAATGSGKTCAFVLPILLRVSRQRARSPPRKPADGVMPNASGGAPAGAWTCVKCTNINWPQRDTCNTRTCKAPRPEQVSTPSKATVASKPATPSALILAPTRELAQQIHVEMDKFSSTVNARTACVYGGVPKGEQAGLLTGKGADVVVATPGRCLDFLKPDQYLGQPISLTKLACLVLDEADRMLEAGFFPAINEIIGSCPPKAKRQTLFFTATWPQSVQLAAKEVVGKSAKKLLVEQQGQLGDLTAHKGVVQRLEVLDFHSAKLPRLVELLQSDLKRGGTCLVFCKTQKRCDWLVRKLETECELTWCAAIHAGKDQHTRQEILGKFRSLSAKDNDQKGVLVATNVAARGLDIPGVPLVIVFDFSSVENYVHQIGRTARAGASGRAITLYVAGDGDANELVNVLQNAGHVVPPPLLKIAKDEAPNPAAGGNTNEIALLSVRQGWKDARWAKQREMSGRPRKHK